MTITITQLQQKYNYDKKHGISRFVYENCKQLLLPKNVIASVLYYLKKINNDSTRTKSVKKLIAAIIIATRKQHYIISINKIESFFKEKYGLSFKWKSYRKLIEPFGYKPFKPEQYFEQALSKLQLTIEQEQLVRKKIFFEKIGNPIVDCEIAIYRILREHGFVHTRHTSNFDDKIKQDDFEKTMSVRHRFYHDDPNGLGMAKYRGE